ncbi:hypothetical protein K1T71_014668 [Dendrolimus kikuchii]|uniref:Uncharacterized protein n=1 Tax=Dendrolimus kikuchii TaxID=765133 RepID=A0ACC1CF35_9NEOP|nr:hypothetical protein K1T71_014668 [Dendrolimus kikuchii]
MVEETGPNTNVPQPVSQEGTVPTQTSTPEQQNAPTPTSEPNSSLGTPLQILQMTNKKFSLMKEELEKILMREDVKDTPVAVISIAGAFRGGKSFMLDYFLRYLQADVDKRKDGTWLGDKDEPLKGFSWRGGSERNTLGVLMWSEPYFVTLDDGTKVTVLLVDTQGIFDIDSSVNDCSTIFAFATLISSLVFFNVRENIKEDDLNNLHLFSKFGELTKTSKGKMYQNLEFLVRDFPYPDETPYGQEGGQMLVDKRLEIKKDQSPELVEVRKNLLESYEKISAFLMPHPGFAVFRPNYDGRWAVVTEDFKTYLSMLAASVFAPSKIVLRKISGRTVTGKDLFEYINSFMSVFEGDDMPSLQTIMKATIEAGLRLASRDAQVYYKSHMEVEVGDSKPSMSAPAVNQFHEKIKKEAVDKFLSKNTMGDDKDVEPHLAKLKQDLEAQLQVYLISNHVKLQKAIKDGNDAYEAYIKSIHKEEPLCLTQSDLTEAHKEAVTAGRRAFDSNRRQVEGVPDDERDTFLVSLEENYPVLRSNNNVNNMAAINEIILSYKSTMASKCVLNPPISEESLNSIHDRELEKAKQELDGKRNHIHKSDDDAYKNTLVERISSSRATYKYLNRASNRKARQMAYYSYVNNMESFWDSDNSYYMCVPPQKLYERHCDMKNKALKLLREGTCMDGECDVLKEMIESHYYDLKEVNNSANQRFEDKAYRIYRNYMDDKTSFNGWWIFGIPYLVNKSNRGDFHDEAKYEAENYFDNHRSIYYYDAYYTSLRWLASRRVLFVGFRTLSPTVSYRGGVNSYIYGQRRSHSKMSTPQFSTQHPPGRSPGHPSPGSPGGFGSTETVTHGVVTRYDNIIKSQEDKREYRGLVLTNRLKVLLVSDPTTDKSAAAMDVNVGYLSDTEELPGLAHFCEHMLFLGTKKYPEENEYNKFLSEHGGASNASTSSDHSTYYFDVLPSHLGKALDIFAQFFIAPLFTESATGRELSAVNSEHEKNMSSDTWRLDQLNKSTADPNHPFHKFGTGNRETLETIPKAKGIDVRKELLKFHDKWYSSNIMTLVVLGKESLDELQEMVVSLFSAVEDKSVTAPSWPEHPFPPNLRRKRAYCLPVKDLRSLSIDFPIPDTRKHYKSGPGHYLSHLLGHEGPGSLLSALKAKGWCNSLVGGTRIGARGFGFFGVQVDLTEDGVQHVDDIIAMVFQYISMLRDEGPKKWVWEEQRDLMALEFRFKDTQEPRSLVTGHVHLLQEFPMEDVLSAYYIMTEWRPELIEELLALLTPDNVRVGIVARCFADKCTQSESWYGTKYMQEDIEEPTIKQWKSAKSVPSLHLPPPNEFIPTKLDLEKGEDATSDGIAPAIIKDTPLMRLWFKKDNEFHLPKAVLTFSLVSPLAYFDPTNCNLTSIWVLLLRDALQQCAYAAELAGLRWNISNAKQGLSVTIEGYDDKQHVLLEKIIDEMVNFKTDHQRFKIMKENHIRAIKNFEAEQPYQHATFQQALCLSDVVWTRSQLLEAAKDITPEQLDDFASRFLRKVHIEALMFGNLSRERALHIADYVENKVPEDAIPLLAQQLLLYREVEMEKGTAYLRETQNSVHKSSCASLYYACGVRATRQNVTLELLAQTLCEPCFNVLRTKEQLGYIVFSGVRRSNGVQGFRVIVQSDRHPAYLEGRIESFLRGSQEYLESMTEEEFLKHRSSLAASKLEKPKTMSNRVSQLWSEIAAQVYNFDRPRVEVEELNTVTKSELLEFYKKHISEDSSESRKLSVHVVSIAEGGAGQNPESNEKTEKTEKTEVKKPVMITDLVEFKSRRRLHPHPAPFMPIPRKGAHCKL